MKQLSGSKYNDSELMSPYGKEKEDLKLSK